ncbi:erythromycin esterase family protein [Niastella sp. OAS944]|uniref:erythromycin esterase family protein n=1 Tax=Niastella sp. OAS944 TaxID=2664089 RepID=UPI0034949C95|nr:erythromycin esterase-like protein [Chitinophagaceae bacterium OAS944]
MRPLFIILFILIALYANSQPLLPIEKCKTAINFKNGCYLDSLMAVIGNKRIVALGEDTHGTAEFYALRAAITQRLIKEKGFNMVILENPHEDMMAMQAALYTEPIDTLMRRHLFSIYQSKQMRSFLQWLRKYSYKNKSVRLAGCDDSQFELLPQALIKTVARYGNENLNNMCEEFLYRQTLSIKEFYTRFPKLKPDTLPKQMKFGHATWCLLNRIDSLCAAQKMQDPLLSELLFHAKTNYVYYDRVIKKETVSRDEIMGNRINYYAADPNAKIVVWAHSGHIAKYAWLDNELGLMGATVQKKFPADYLAIGMSGGQGSYSFMKNRFINDDHNFTDSLFRGILHTSKTGSWNELLMTNTTGNFYLDFSRLTPAEKDDFNKQRPLKLLGYGKEDDKASDYYDISLTRLFDVLIFLKETNQTTALFN